MFTKAKYNLLTMNLFLFKYCSNENFFHGNSCWNSLGLCPNLFHCVSVTVAPYLHGTVIYLFKYCSSDFCYFMDIFPCVSMTVALYLLGTVLLPINHDKPPPGSAVLYLFTVQTPFLLQLLDINAHYLGSVNAALL